MWVGAHFGQVHSLLPNTQLPQLNGDVNYSGVVLILSFQPTPADLQTVAHTTETMAITK